METIEEAIKQLQKDSKEISQECKILDQEAFMYRIALMEGLKPRKKLTDRQILHLSATGGITETLLDICKKVTSESKKQKTCLEVIHCRHRLYGVLMIHTLLKSEINEIGDLLKNVGQGNNTLH